MATVGEIIDRIESNGRDFWDLYSDERVVLGNALIFHDPYDQFGWVQEWRFAIADYLHFDMGETVTGFLPAPGGPDTDSYAYDELCDISPSVEALRYALRILDRYREWLRIAGKDY